MCKQRNIGAESSVLSLLCCPRFDPAGSPHAYQQRGTSRFLTLREPKLCKGLFIQRVKKNGCFNFAGKSGLGL